ncbi:unnamed protein product [Ambrosiozyma monospora]|uniref:Unnamed protein product n=1 Tax=Ambrosiozyma monospora TaxID=43982 RepID=A0ACB5SSL0_AMBMO|nr:unnamed protein product [Ambrosiozyma monospora]
MNDGSETRRCEMLLLVISESLELRSERTGHQPPELALLGLPNTVRLEFFDVVVGGSVERVHDYGKQQ